MAGKPRVKRVIEDLTLRAQRELDGELDEPATALDFVEHWLTNGGTLRSLAGKLQRDSEHACLPYEPALDGGGLGRMIRRRFGDAASDDRLGRARARGSHALVDETHDIADEPVLTSEDAARARNRIGVKQWAASAYDKATFGQRNQQQVAVSVNLGIAHLDAMRHRVVSSQATVTIEQPTEAEVVIEAGDEEQLSLLPSTT